MTTHTQISYQKYHKKFKEGTKTLDTLRMTLSEVTDNNQHPAKYLENQKLVSDKHSSPSKLSKKEWTEFVNSSRHQDLLEIREGRRLAIQEIELQKALKQDSSIRATDVTPDIEHTKEKS